MAELSAGAVALLQAKNYATLVTLMADGSPQATVVWVDTDGTHVLVNTAEGRVKSRNARRDPRVAVSVYDLQNPIKQLQVRGRIVEVATEGAVEHINKLSQKYSGRQYSLREGEQRVILRILPEKVSGNAAE
ncbi:MAG: PPOX class F420-dependent oxidoreductase [Chloroflexi bacterium]|nr:PPOX class F420-dependent oxidoreductase [Chloroflexota bacterium]